jgi:hypothetical protein
VGEKDGRLTFNGLVMGEAPKASNVVTLH